MKRNKAASAIFIHVDHEGSYKPAPTRSRPGPTTPALVAECIRMKKSGRRRTPNAAMKVMTDPESTQSVDSHINILAPSIFFCSLHNETSKCDSCEKATESNAQHHVDKCLRADCHSSQRTRTHPEQAQHVQRNNPVPGMWSADDTYTHQNHRSQQ